jgi:hypothetical protein
MTKHKSKWKKNFRNIPDQISKKVAELNKDDITVAAVKKIKAADITSGVYNHIGISIQDGNLTYKSEIVPSPQNGRYSEFNVNGQEKKRTDLPMVTKTYSWEVPNFGDSFKGTHEVTREREVYRIDFTPPQNLRIKVELIGKEEKGDIFYVLKFSTSAVLNRSDRNFNKDLMFNINFIQENTGVANIFQSDATHSDYLKTVFVSWEILPPGEREETVNRILSGMRNVDPEVKKKLIGRYELLDKLKPIAYIQGSSGFQRYFGAKFSEKLVVFENIEYGNAMYVMFEQWEELSKLSRMELLKNKDHNFIRIIHTSGWENELKKVVKK